MSKTTRSKSIQNEISEYKERRVKEIREHSFATGTLHPFFLHEELTEYSGVVGHINNKIERRAKFMRELPKKIATSAALIIGIISFFGALFASFLSLWNTWFLACCIIFVICGLVLSVVTDAEDWWDS